MGQYICEVQATSNSTAGTEDEFVELKSGSGLTLLIKRVRVDIYTPSQDSVSTIRLLRNSAAGSTGVAYTPLKKRQGAPGSAATCNVKNTTSAFSVGTNVDNPDRVDVNGRAIWEWIPRGSEEFIETGSNGYFAVGIKCSTASVVHDVTVEWEE
jgi:hypothetical protein